MRLDDDDFTLFDLPRRYALTAAELDGRWRDLQSQVHPDRFASEGAVAQRMAMQWSVRVNEAYRRLKDPLSRAAYLCQLQGVDPAGQARGGLPPALLMQQMQWREALEEASDGAALTALNDEVTLARKQLFEALPQQLGDRGPELQDWQAGAATVNALMFVSRFQRDLEERIDEALNH